MLKGTTYWYHNCVTHYQLGIAIYLGINCTMCQDFGNRAFSVTLTSPKKLVYQ